MKKLPVVFLCLLLCLTGCEKAENVSLTDTVRAEADSGDDPSLDAAEVPVTTPTPAPIKTVYVGRPVEGASGTEYMLGRTELAGGNGFSFRAEGMSVNRYGDHILSVSWQNSTDKTYLIIPDAVRVNGYLFDPAWAAMAEPNSSGKSDICFAAEEMALLGLSFCDEITFTLNVCAEDALFTEYLIRDEAVTLRPTGIAEGAVLCPGVQHRDGEVLLMSEGGLTCLLLGPETEYDASAYGCVLLVWLENGTDTPLTFQLDSVAVNGEAIDPYWAEELPPHSRAYSRIFFTVKDLAGKDILSVDALEGKLCVYYPETYDTVAEKEFTYYPAGTAE